MTVFICPQPQDWHDIHTRLKNAWEEAGGRGSPPPVPLILAGWAFSSDADKKDRWEQTITWAKGEGLEQLIPELTPEMEYRVDEIRKSVIVYPDGDGDESV